jgi:succinate dehydrogenase/fumarate reductase flavoprotein subunit
MGQAAAAGLRAGLLDASVPVWLSTPLVSLTLSGGAVTGVVISRGGSQSLVDATKGVIVAAGGFEHNAAMRAQYQQQPIGTSWTVGTASNTGDGIQAGIQAGAALALMDDAWWGPVIPLPGEPYFCLAERTEPGGLIVNAAGERFTNEAAPYYAFKIEPGDLGTKGGLVTDARARVLRADGTVIPRLYAAGNSSAAVMGHSYAGAGSTIGPAMTFGYVAANDIASA